MGNVVSLKRNEEFEAMDQADTVLALEEAMEGGQDESLDHFITRNGKVYAGTHLIIDLWDAENLDDVDLIEEALRGCVDEAGATLLHLHLHRFTPNGGVSGVAVLAESHISIHTWPERGFAALDVFMCGDAEPEKTVGVLRKFFKPGNYTVGDHLRGRVR